MDKINISKEYLDEVIGFIGKSLCGKIMRRFEITDDKNAIKSNVKELIYEEMRNFKEILIAYNYGRQITQFEFKVKPKE